MHSRTIVSRILSGLLLVSFLGCDATFTISIDLWEGLASEEFSQTASSADLNKIAVTTKNGTITVKVDSSATDITIAGTKTAIGEDDTAAKDRLSEIKIKATRNAQDPTLLEITAELPLLTGLIRDTVNFVITLPAGSNLDLNTSNGAIDVSDNVGEVTATTNNGKITITDNTGSVDANTSNGKLELTDIASGSVKGRTSNGSITVKATIKGFDSIDVKTSNGSVDISVPVDTSASLDLRTVLGSIVTSFGAIDATDIVSNMILLTATLNGGGGEITGQTSLGTITFTGI